MPRASKKVADRAAAAATMTIDQAIAHDAMVATQATGSADPDQALHYIEQGAGMSAAQASTTSLDAVLGGLKEQTDKRLKKAASRSGLAEADRAKAYAELRASLRVAQRCAAKLARAAANALRNGDKGAYASDVLALFQECDPEAATTFAAIFPKTLPILVGFYYYKDTPRGGVQRIPHKGLIEVKGAKISLTSEGATWLATQRPIIDTRASEVDNLAFYTIKVGSEKKDPTATTYIEQVQRAMVALAKIPPENIPAESRQEAYALIRVFKVLWPEKTPDGVAKRWQAAMEKADQIEQQQ